MGEELQKTGYNYANVLFNHVTYPQDQRNCVKCHTASNASTAALGDNWKNVPSRLACGACHDKVNFVTGENHGSTTMGGAQLDDKLCTSCHASAAVAQAHIPVLPPNPLNAFMTGPTGNNNTNASSIAAYTNNLPAGAITPTWDLKSVTLNASRNPVFTFAFKQNGTIVPFRTYAAGTVDTFWANFVGGPSFYIAMGVAQDGVAAPADWNVTNSVYFPNVWRGDGKAADGNTLGSTAAATLTGPDGSGYYTLTMTATAVPLTATMVTGGIGYTYGLKTTPPLVQTNVVGYGYVPLVWTGVGTWTNGTGQGGLAVPAPNVTKLVSGTLPTGMVAQAGRRAIVTTAKCNDCHAALGIFTAKTYHAAQRNDAPTCTFCHNVNRVNSGWGVNIKEAVHAIHASGKRVNKFSWEVSAGDYYWLVEYPAILNDCEACHVSGSYDFSVSGNANAIPNLLWTTVATGTVPATVPVVVTGAETLPGTYYSPFLVPSAGQALGSGYGYSFATNAITAAAATTLVSSPVTSACGACHDTPVAIAHFKGNGGSFYEARSTALAKVEQCLICHGSGKIADIRSVHMTF